jgi:hypothetical protein
VVPEGDVSLRLAFGVAAAAITFVAAVQGAVGARAADECAGLPVCLPVAGPWVVLPAGAPSRADWELRCPRDGYVVAGTDARLADPEIDVSLRGETGSPVAPGVITSRAVLFSAAYVGERRAPTTFRPFIGCMPTSGGGGRALTGVAALRPTRPVARRVSERLLPAGGSVRVVVTCRTGETLVGAGHALAFRAPAPPSRRTIAAVRAARSVDGSGTVTVSATSALPAGVAVVQVIARCRKDVRR